MSLGGLFCGHVLHFGIPIFCFYAPIFCFGTYIFCFGSIGFFVFSV